MMVNSPLEIYGAVIGAQVYDDFFNIMYSFGFVYLPLVFIALSGIKTLLESPWGYRVAVGRAYWQLGGWMAAVMFALIPIYPLSVNSITYTPVCSTGAEVSTYGNTGTTYDQVLGSQGFPNVNVPPLMAFFMEAFSGVTNAAITSLPCNTDVPAIQGTIDTTQMNPQLAESVKRFNTECFAKAAAEMTNQNPDPDTYSTIENEYGGASDLGWIGSHVYQNLYYSTLYPSTPVPGFPYNNFPYPYQSYNSQNSNMATPQWGFPNCEQWWSDPVFGLEGQLVNAVQAQQPNDPHLGNIPIVNQVGTWLEKIATGNNVGSQVTSSDAIAYSLLYDKGSESAFANNGFSDYINDNGFDSGNSVVNLLGTLSLTHAVTNISADIGQGFNAINSSMARVEIQHQVEIMQAVLLTILISVGPLVMLAGNLRMSVIFTYFFLIGSVILVAFLEQLIHYLEMSVYASSGMLNSLEGLGSEYPFVYNVFTKLYQYAPFIYLSVMSWCGIAAGDGIQQLMSNNASIAGKSQGVGTKIAATAAKVAEFL
jgi:hypothetical protein